MLWSHLNKLNGRMLIVYNLAKGVGIHNAKITLTLASLASCLTNAHGASGVYNFFVAEDINTVSRCTFYHIHVYQCHDKLFCLIFIGPTVSRRLQVRAPDDVLSIWTEVGKTVPWANVECY